ncbi:alpha-galactosidase [Aureococcus anophagefferens]|nr:alpha-galactosidase [Aureococcus anophagefferens]
MVANGMLAKGYEWIVLDDCWHPTRDQSGDLVPSPTFFPDGMQPVIDYSLNATGREMILELCRGPYAGEDGWGYAPQIAQTDAEYRTEAASYAVLSSPMMVGTTCAT